MAMSFDEFFEYFNKTNSNIRSTREMLYESNTPGLSIYLIEETYRFRKHAIDALVKGIISPSDCSVIIAVTDAWRAPIPNLPLIERLKAMWMNLVDSVFE